MEREGAGRVWGGGGVEGGGGGGGAGGGRGVSRQLVEVLPYVHRNRRFIRDGSPGRPPRLSHSS